jgi:hypothetical protein
MANYKRKRPALRTFTHTSSRERLKRNPAWNTRWMDSWPAWHDVLYHRRFARRKEKKELQRIMNGYIELDTYCFAPNHKPHHYYW